MKKTTTGLFMLAGALLCLGASTATAQNAQDRAAAAAKKVDGNFIRANAAQKTPDWPSVGLDYAESRFSKLDQVNAGNVKALGLVWSYDLESTRGVEATPLVVDGIMYVTASWSVVHAIDTRTGQKLWTFDPQVDKSKGFRGCCDVVNRGVALHEGRVYVAAYDGRLIALDAATGTEGVGEEHHRRPEGQLHHHRRAARVQGQGHHRQRRRRVRRARLRHRLRREDRRPEVALVRGAGRSGQALRGRIDGARRQDLGPERQILGGRRRRHRVGQLRLRPRPQPHVRGHRQRLAVGAQGAQPQGRRQPVPRLGGRARPRYRQVRVALPGDARRQLGLHLHAVDDPGQRQARRQGAQGAAACAQERLLLRHRSHQRQVHLGEELRRCELGHRLRQERPADRDRRRAPEQSPATAFPDPSARTTGIRCRSIRRPAWPTCRRSTCRST
jgi:hypothetical protein